MSSGLKWVEDPARPDSDLIRAITSGDAAAYAADRTLAHDPGGEFLYSGGDTFLLDRIVAGEVGSGREFREFMDAELLDKIGMSPTHLEFDGAGTWLGAYAAETTARSFAKFGLLYLRDGVWNGERILPERWVEYKRSGSIPSTISCSSTSRPKAAATWLCRSPRRSSMPSPPPTSQDAGSGRNSPWTARLREVVTPGRANLLNSLARSRPTEGRSGMRPEVDRS